MFHQKNKTKQKTMCVQTIGEDLKGRKDAAVGPPAVSWQKRSSSSTAASSKVVYRNKREHT
jgi:hypothetical protein